MAKIIGPEFYPLVGASTTLFLSIFQIYLAAMFTGIVECMGKVLSIDRSGSNIRFWIESPISGELGIDQSVSHDGVCLTVDALEPGKHRVTAIEETLSKTNLGTWLTGTELNLERCMKLDGRLDGHIVQGHVDATALCTERKQMDGSWEFSFDYPDHFAPLVIEKGSIAVNGTSLTCFAVTRNSFRIAVIPYTFENTNIHKVTAGTSVNIEFDILGKYVQRRMDLTGK